MINKRFTDIEHDYENAWIKCKDDGDFMIYAIYGDLDEGLPSLENLLNGLDGTVKSLTKDYEQLLKKNKELKARYNRCIEEMDSLAEVNDKFYKENKELKAKVDDKEVAVEVECEKLMQRVFEVIDKKIEELEIDLNRSIKAGMPTGALWGETDLLEELKEELKKMTENKQTDEEKHFTFDVAKATTTIFKGVSVRAKNKEEAIQKIKDGDWDGCLDEWVEEEGEIVSIDMW